MKKFNYWIISLALLTLLGFSPVLFNDFVNFDDTIYITSNRYVQEGLTANSITWAFTQKDISYWQPLTWLSLMAANERSKISQKR